LIYHFVCPAKYRKVIFNDEVDEVLKNTCLKIEKRYEIKFIAKQNSALLAAQVAIWAAGFFAIEATDVLAKA
jgi:REP element-mobilizing transposase RayT